MEVSLALLTLLGSCCVGLVLLVVLIVVVVLVLTGRVKKAEVSGLGAKVALEGAEPPRPEAPADTPAPPPTSPAEERPHIDKQQAGVDFGEGGDFTGAKISGVAGRDIRRGSAAAESPGGKAPGVDFGKKGKFRDAEIEDVAGRDIVESGEDSA